jgi:hypothetical protein
LLSEHRSIGFEEICSKGSVGQQSANGVKNHAMNSGLATRASKPFLVILPLLSTLLLCLSAPAALPGVQPGTHTPFVTVLLRNWDLLDTNHDGVLSVAEIDRAVLDPSIKGEDAAVVGTLKLMSRSTKVTVPTLSREYFLEYDRQASRHARKIAPAAAEAATSDTTSSAAPTTMPARGQTVAGKTTAINWDLYFAAGKKRIARGRGVDSPDQVDLADLRQGALGDCFLVATVGSMAAHRPAELNQLIKPTADGNYQVTLPGVAPFTIHALTQSELVLSSTSSGEGVWLAALEQGFGKFRARQKGSVDEEGTDLIAAGGQPGATMSLLTGHRYKRVFLAVTAERRKTEEAKMLPILRENLIASLKDHRLMTASVTPPTPPTTSPATNGNVAPSTGPSRGPSSRPVLTAAMLPKLPPDINSKHSYAVLGYDAKTDMLTIWNPHGQTFKPKGPDGLQNGYTTTHGEFHVPLKEAYSFFTEFYFETGEPAAPPATAPVKQVSRNR